MVKQDNLWIIIDKEKLEYLENFIESTNLLHFRVVEVEPIIHILLYFFINVYNFIRKLLELFSIHILLCESESIP